MKKGSNIYIIIFSFLVGVMTAYFTLQFRYFKINTELNVIESLLSSMTIVMGLHIATSIQKRHNRSQSLHSILKNKIDSFWIEFATFDQRLDRQDTLEMKIATKTFKNFLQELNIIKVIFSSFSMNDDCINKLEKSIDRLNDLITSELQVSNNRITLSNQKVEIKKLSTDVHQNIVNVFKNMNNIL